MSADPSERFPHSDREDKQCSGRLPVMLTGRRGSNGSLTDEQTKSKSTTDSERKAK